MILRKLDENALELVRVEEINNEAFPASARMEVAEFFELGKDNEVDVLIFCDDEEVVAFAVTIRKKNTVYILHFAVDAAHRSQGYGREALDCMKREYADCQICLDFEQLDPDSDNAEQRQRRRSFYLRNGFEPTNVFTTLHDTDHYEVVCFGGELDREALQEIVIAIHSLKPAFSPELLIGS